MTVRVVDVAGDGAALSCKPECLALAEARLRELNTGQFRIHELGPSKGTIRNRNSLDSEIGC
jgi:hypothetical protein